MKVQVYERQGKMIQRKFPETFEEILKYYLKGNRYRLARGLLLKKYKEDLKQTAIELIKQNLKDQKFKDEED